MWTATLLEVVTLDNGTSGADEDLTGMSEMGRKLPLVCLFHICFIYLKHFSPGF